MRRQQTWAIEDHLCRHCGGRILRCVRGNGPTGGGNPLYRCSLCGRSAAAIGPEALCWCDRILYRCSSTIELRESVRKAMEEAKA